MSGRAAYSSGAEVLDARAANALVGAWRQLGSDVSFTRGAPVRDHRGGWGGGWGGERRWDRERRDHRGGQGQFRELRREEWERTHPGERWEERERRRAEWERWHPGVPFVGVEALVGAVGTLAQGGTPPTRAWLRDMPPPTMANRQVLPMNTGTTPVPQNTTAQITSRPQRVAFRPERVFVSANDIGGSGSAANWIINDITIGNRSQFAQSGALPGDMFATQAIDSFVTFETAQTAMDVVLIATYQGPTEGGTPFYGAIIGTAAL